MLVGYFGGTPKILKPILARGSWFVLAERKFLIGILAAFDGRLRATRAYFAHVTGAARRLGSAPNGCLSCEFSLW